VTETLAFAEFRKIEHPLRELFPPDREGSPLMVAILVRSDEIAHMFLWMQRASETENARASIGDPRLVLDRVIIVRMFLVSSLDGVDKLQKFMALPEIHRMLAEHGPIGDDFAENVRELRKVVESLKPIRNQLGAHLDLEPIRSRLRAVQPNDVGVMWLADSEHIHTQYDCAHEIAVGAWSHVATRGAISHGAGDDLDRISALFGVAQHAQVKFVAAARVALHLFEATATAANAPSAQIEAIDG